MIIQCPHCCTELELPDESVGWKVQCIYCNKKFIATEEFVKQQKEALKKKTLRIPPIKRKEEQHGYAHARLRPQKGCLQEDIGERHLREGRAEVQGAARRQRVEHRRHGEQNQERPG